MLCERLDWLRRKAQSPKPKAELQGTSPPHSDNLRE